MPRVHAFAASCAMVLAAGVSAPSAQAGTVGLHVRSVHLPARTFSNSNPGVYYRSDGGWTAGAYRNSLRRASVYAGYTWEWRSLAVTAGGVTGYDRALQPMLVPSVGLFTVHGVHARLAFIPRFEKRIESHVVHLMLEY